MKTKVSQTPSTSTQRKRSVNTFGSHHEVAWDADEHHVMLGVRALLLAYRAQVVVRARHALEAAPADLPVAAVAHDAGVQHAVARSLVAASTSTCNTSQSGVISNQC